MPGGKIKAVLFDLGNVLVDFDVKIATARIADFCDKSQAEIFNLLLSSAVTDAFEKGKLSPQEFYRQARGLLNLKLGYESFVTIWNDIFFLNIKNRAVYHIANCLKNRYCVALLSNTNVLHYEYLKQNFPVFDVFHKIFLSFELGVTKPHEEIYRKVTDILKISPAEIFYTDDRPDLAGRAQGLGLKSYLFRSARQLHRDLLSCGIDFKLYEKQKS